MTYWFESFIFTKFFLNTYHTLEADKMCRYVFSIISILLAAQLKATSAGIP